MKNFIVRIKLARPDGSVMHLMRAEGVSMEDVMIRFGMSADGNDFMAVKCFRTSILDGEQSETEYGVVFPLTSVLEVLYQEV